VASSPRTTLRGVDTRGRRGVHLDITRSIIFTIVLLSSSFTMHLNTMAADRGDRHRACGGCSSPSCSAWPSSPTWPRVVGNDFTMTDNAYGSIYYLLTGFHGLHLVGGLALMIAAAVAVSGTESHVPLGPTFTISAYYWHFVDAVWIFVFLTIFVVQ
jgi:cytochrome c oxidase subunit 3